MPPLTNSSVVSAAASVTPARTGSATGVALGAGAYVLWGLFPGFLPLLRPANPVEILAHRVAWTLVVMAGLALFLGTWSKLLRLSGRGWLMVAAAALLIAVNWGTYIYGVTSGQVIETALGYFINPLVSVLLGIAVLRERLRWTQWIAIGIAAIAVVVLTVNYGRIPVIALTLACSFGTYGLIKKMVPLDSASSLTAESAVLGPLALGYLAWLQFTGVGTFVDHGIDHTLLLLSAGPVTAIPLLMFGAAARRVPLVTIGILQYLAPILQFAWGLLVVREPMPASRWIGFGLVWLALLVFTVDALHAAHRSRRDAATASNQLAAAPVAGD